MAFCSDPSSYDTRCNLKVAFVGREVNLWRVYLPAMVFGLVAMGPFCRISERTMERVEKVLYGYPVATILFGIFTMGFASKPLDIYCRVCPYSFIGCNMLSHYFRALWVNLQRFTRRGLLGSGKYICIYGNIYRWNCCRIYHEPL